MAKLDMIALAVLAFIVTLVPHLLGDGETGPFGIASDTVVFFSVGAFVAIPVVFMLPRVRVRFFCPTSRVPSSTYFLPRWLVRPFVSVMIGGIVAAVVLAIVQDYCFFWYAASWTILCGAFWAGARRRLKKHPCTEFPMPLWRMLFR